MGWTYGSWEPREEIAKYLLGQLNNDSYQVLAHSLVGNHLWFVADRTKHIEGCVDRSIGLCLLQGWRGHGWGYKDLDEGCGPCEVDCPITYLTLAPEPTNEYSRRWREDVRQYHAVRSAKRKSIKDLKVGMTIRLRKGCTPEVVTITSLNPLRGSGYRIKPRHLPDVIEEVKDECNTTSC